MNSSDLEAFGFVGWFPFSFDQEDILLNRLPNSMGVYAIKFSASQSRRYKESDLAYIGKASNKSGLRLRIRQYFHPGGDNRTNLRMQRHIREHPILLLGYVTTANRSSTQVLESRLLLQFEQEHGELPPFNRQRALSAMNSL